MKGVARERTVKPFAAISLVGVGASPHGLICGDAEGFEQHSNLTPGDRLPVFPFGPGAIVAGMQRADSVAFDFHKWAQVPYDAGCIVVRDPAAHRAAFARDAAYLRPQARGLAAGEPWPVDLGPELSRGFRALKSG